ncbi:MAG TPA: hypothetical protein VHZ96_22750, partial [Frankiaceae bacterium]|nr:hypothetical protein [Frankiaceae bacterium]
SQATASPSAIKPVDTTGPFEEVQLTGLTPGMTYHYAIGAAGIDHTFKTVPTGSFTWVDMGDTTTTSCEAYMAQTHSLAAAQDPNFVTHGGDISYANECGTQAVHQYYLDEQVWSTSAAFQPVWGNHEYGSPQPDSVPGAVRDTLENYKGRSFITNAQAVPNDTASLINNPGCGWATKSKVNTCLGEDWGYFLAGHVLYISYPEPWPGAQSNWGTRADPIMAAAQADPNIDFIVTYGHRPAYTSLNGQESLDIRNAVNALAAKYSPTAAHPKGKYILNIAHHVHGEEVFKPINGLVNITNGGGGAGTVNYNTPPDPNSLFRLRHTGILSSTYDASAHTMTVHMLCGPVIPGAGKDTCTYGSVVYSQTFTASTPPTPQPGLNTSLTDGVTSVQTGNSVTYHAAVSSPSTSTGADGVDLSAVIPANATVTDAGGGAESAGTISWEIGPVSPGQTVTKTFTLQVTGGTSLAVSAHAAATDTACTTSGSTCSATDTDTVGAVPPPFKQWIGNQSVETDLTGWSGKYGPNAAVTVTRDATLAHTGVASIKIAGLTGAKNLSSGVNDNPRWVLSTTAGKVYTQSAWVDPTFVGQQIFMKLREWKGNTLVTDKTVTLKATSVGWQQLTQNVTAGGTGNQFSFAVYGVMSAGQSFHVDDLSLTSPS